MPASTAPRWGVLYGWAAGEDFWGGPMNQNMQLIDALLYPYVLNMNFGSPPQNIEDGDQYIVSTPSSGDWANQDGNLATRIDGTWVFNVPTRGVRCRLANLNSWIWYDGVAWVDEGTGQAPGTDPGLVAVYYDVGGFVPYAITGDEWVMYLPIVQPVSLPQNAAGSSFKMATASPGYVTLNLFRNATNVGTVSVNTNGMTGTFDIPSPVSFGSGDVFGIRAPTQIIEGFKNFGWTFRMNVVE